MNHTTTSASNTGIAVALDGGARLGQFQPGALEYLDEMGVQVKYYSGTSIGSVVAALRANDYTPAHIAEILPRAMFNGRFDVTNPMNVVTNALDWRLIPNMLSFMFDPLAALMPGLDIEPIMQDLVKQYDLKPRMNLKTVAYDITPGSQGFVVFEMAGSPGSDDCVPGVRRVHISTQEELGKALAASCCLAVPGIIRPVMATIGGVQMHLVDAGYAHASPAVVITEPTIELRLLTVNSCERNHDFVVDLGSWLEQVFAPMSSFDAGRMVREGYQRARRALEEHILSGRIPSVLRRRHALEHAPQQHRYALAG